MHLVGVGKHTEAFEGGGEAEGGVEGDEGDAVGAFAAPDQGGGELEGGGGLEDVDGENAQGAGAHLLGGLHLEGPGAQVVDHRAGLLEVGGGDPLLAVGGEEGLAAFERRSPPEGDLRVALLRRFFDSLSWLPYHFDFTAGGQRVFSVDRRWGVRDWYQVDIPDPRIDRRLVIAMAVGLDTLQGR